MPKNNDAQLPMALEGGALNAKTVSEAVTTPLWKLCIDSADAREAARKISASRDLLNDCRDNLALVQRLAGPCGPEACRIALQPLEIMYGTPDFGPGPAGEKLKLVWWETVLKALMDLPLESLELAVSKFIATSTKHYFPDPGVLRKSVEEHANQLRTVAYRLKVAAESQPVRRPPPTQAEKEKVAADLADFAKQLTTRRETMPDAIVNSRPNPDRVAAIVAAGLKPQPRETGDQP